MQEDNNTSGHHVFITGTTGMVGKGVLYECLEDETIATVTVVNRSSLGMKHPKLKEVLLQDFMEIAADTDGLAPFDACFHCMGVSALGLNEEQYTRITFEMTKKLADTMYTLNANMVFTYVSGAGTDSTEKGRSMWARVKGRAENYVLNKGFARACIFRAGMILPEKGITSRTGWYNAIYIITRPLFPLLKKSNHITTTTRLGRAMIHALSGEAPPTYLENKEINMLAQRGR